MMTLLSAGIAYHGQVGAWDEIGLIAAGVIAIIILLVLLWRGRRFEPEYEDDDLEAATSPASKED